MNRFFVSLAQGLLLFISVPAFALQVAFLEVRAPDGRPVVLEPGGRFAHVAISYASGWLHAHPAVGVAWTRSLDSFGTVAVVLEPKHSTRELSTQRVEPLLGLPYDFEFSWSDQAYYCSELVAKLLGMTPTPMDFAGERWKRHPHRLPEGELGVSPDELYRWLIVQPEWMPIE